MNRTVALALVTGLVATLAGCNARTDSGYPDSGSSTTARNDAPAPRYDTPPPTRTATVPAGTVVSIELLDSVASNSSTAGTRVRARVAEAVRADGVVAIPRGTPVSGVVTEAVGLKKIGGTAKLRLDFTGIGNSDTHASYAAQGKSETKKDAGTIAGATAGGAILGRIIGHQKDNDARGTAIGAVVGAATGTAIAAKTKGQEIYLPSGHVIDIILDEPLEVTTRG